jgi:beta-phosphoglucomutase family hydrolase
MGADIPTVSRERFDAVLFDLDGVITATAKVHAACWKKAFDEFLQKRAAEKGEDFQPFDIKADYEEYVDGKPRDEGVRSFLKSRQIELPQGHPDDPPDRKTVAGLGNRKTKLFEQALKEGGVDVYEGSIEWLKQLRRKGIKTAIVSSSKHCKMIIEAAGISELFEARVDGKVSEELGLKGKPAPDIFLKAAEMLEAPPERAVVVEDAIAGVQAGRQGGFGLVLGVGRSREAQEALRKNGADVVVQDLEEMLG